SELSSLAQKDTESLPEICVHLNSGALFTGTVLNFEQGHQQDLLVLQTTEGYHAATYKQHIVYINCLEICALSLNDIHQNPALIPIITAGKLSSSRAAEAVTKLDFQSWLNEVIQELAPSLHPSFTLEVSQDYYGQTEDYSSLKDFIERLKAAFFIILSDKVGKEALINKVQTVILIPGTDLTIKLEELGRLKITLNGATHNAPGLSTKELVASLEQIL
ncbi:MAG TPA: hypothetical protein VL947_12100, partial [Cytophagales bacterium]|nr:hypothetical protein [Cytophagales bacterium]